MVDAALSSIRACATMVVLVVVTVTVFVTSESTNLEVAVSVLSLAKNVDVAVEVTTPTFAPPAKPLCPAVTVTLPSFDHLD